jgi:hypothetical protein
MFVVLISTAILLSGLNAAATFVLVRSGRYDRGQKILQTLLVWLVPVVGALLVWALARDTITNRTTMDLTDGNALDSYMIPDGMGEGIGRE